jgi:hypothetical protein
MPDHIRELNNNSSGFKITLNSFVIQCCGSGFGAFLTPGFGIPDGKIGTDPDPG